jgi:hypothetical protein
MRNLHSRSFRNVLYPMLFKSIGCVVLTIFLSSCSANLPFLQESQQADDVALATQYSILFIIHGDGDYLYHDTSGNEYNADEEALAGAIKVAQENPRAEVFIFHQRPRRHFLFLFPLRDGEFYYYRNGQLIANELYWRDQEQSNFKFEVGLYRHFRAKKQRKLVSVFLYCGHEIPEFGGSNYDASYPDRKFTVYDFASGLKDFTPDSTRFDLMILSTCFGGTPYTIGELGSFSRTIIASPDNLHLSYFDLHLLERMDLSLQDGDVPAFAKRLAQQTFDRLTRDIQTTVSVAVYDVDRVQEFLHSVHKTYDNTLSTLRGKTQAFLATIEHCDCADLPAYLLPTMNEGVDVFYRPASFGRLKNKKYHSGWECWKYEDHSMQPQRP